MTSLASFGFNPRNKVNVPGVTQPDVRSTRNVKIERLQCLMSKLTVIDKAARTISIASSRNTRSRGCVELVAYRQSASVTPRHAILYAAAKSRFSRYR